MGLDYYGILELTKNSEDLDIKKAWVENNNMYNVSGSVCESKQSVMIAYFS